MAARLAICALLAIAAAADARSLLAPSPGAQSCATACGGAPGVFFGAVRKPAGVPDSYACVVTVPLGQDVVGFQLTGAPGTCTAVDANENVLVSDDFECMCKESGETQGLSMPGPSGTCADSCVVGVDGSAGRPMSLDQASYACMPAAEVGIGNRFGSAAGKTCAYAGNNGPVAAERFSCVCLFATGGAAGSQRTPTPEQPRVQPALPTAG